MERLVRVRADLDFCKRLKEGKFIYDYIRTDKPATYEIQYEFQDWYVTDIGGTPRGTMQWRNFLEGAHGIIFMIDSVNKNDYILAKAEIENLINNHYSLKSAMVLLFNKRDLMEEIDNNTMRKLLVEMNLSNRTLTEKNIRYKLISLLTGEGFEEAVRELYHQMDDLVARRY